MHAIMASVPKLVLLLVLSAFPGISVSLSLELGSSIDKLELTVLPDAYATSAGARCLDSSPAAYYSALGTGADASRWIVYLEGGGECESREDCEQRSRSPLGSSSSYKKHIDAFDTGPIMGRDKGSNPAFASWSVLYIPYCSGDDWLGTMTRVCDAWTAGSCDGPDSGTVADDQQQLLQQAEAKGLFHAGHNIIEASLDHAATAFGLDKASTILVSGGSAGGQGAYYHADWLKAKYPQKQVLSAPEYGEVYRIYYTPRATDCCQDKLRTNTHTHTTDGGFGWANRLVWGAFLCVCGLESGQEDRSIYPIPLSGQQRLRTSLGPKRQTVPRTGAIDVASSSSYREIETESIWS